MKNHLVVPVILSVLLFVAMFYAGLASSSSGREKIYNPLIDYRGFKKQVLGVESSREKNKLTLDEFLKIAKQAGTIVLDARSKDKFDMKHIAGAVHLAFTDFTQKTLARVIPSKNTKVLIYCNNNFTNDSEEFMTKSAPTALNVHTTVSLAIYGYKNVSELGPALDENNPKLTFESSPKGDASITVESSER